MLTENGYNKALEILKIPKTYKDFLPTKSFEVQKVVKKILETARPENYNPLHKEKKVVKVTRESAIRARGFRQAVVEAYDCSCAFCGMRINSPDTLMWEVEAAHIVPSSSMGKDDIWNGIALCRLHHWAFDVGWFTLQNDYTVQVSQQVNHLPSNFGRIGDYDFIRIFSNKTSKINLPKSNKLYPHSNAITWHRENKFYF